MEGLYGATEEIRKAFKDQVVVRILTEELPASETTKELSVHNTTVNNWLKLYKQDGESSLPDSGNRNLKADDEEIRKLHK
ncbi:hypothetical protein BK133_26040 [Paenibacillus sp. FSL H8-0548]|uniref:transposase n=1 Tax=Paenibacillus sp. FSL H8-0548 TaxID=1920422 RepID=UPI00096DDA06|nr:transposase [Paenibacillus sp. FSL H8-0548]OMF22588.1 hypothetical protein BK133_26040 [Paenibacillus sp. FSL H8-0548]